MNNRLESRIMRNWRAAALLLLSVTMGPQLAWAENSILSVTSSQQANGEVVRVELSEPLKVKPSGFAVQTPPRVAIDLPGVVNGMSGSSVEINQGNVRTKCRARPC